MKKNSSLLKCTVLIVCMLEVFALVFPTGVFAVTQQNLPVKGIVLDEDGEPLIGVSVQVEGGTVGSITNVEGRFSINVPVNKQILKFSYVGFVTQRVVVKDRKELRITMSEDLKQLDEVVVVGYGTQQKSHLTGSVTKVNIDGLDENAVPRLDQALMGRTAGVQILNTTSEVGASPEITIRGGSSYSANTAPLVIVDGFEMSDGLEVINPADVASIEILKDAASAAIYGSRAANGVIMITTKAGLADKPRNKVNFKFGSKSPYKLHPIMNTKEYVNLCIRDANLLGRSLGNVEFAKSVIDTDTDWQRLALRDNAYMYLVDFSVSGGSKKLKYYISGSYADDEGMMRKNYYKRYTMRARIDAQLSKRVSVGVNLMPSYTKSERPAINFYNYTSAPAWAPARHTEYTAAITGQPVGSLVRGLHFNNITVTGIDPQTGLERTVTTTGLWNTTQNNAYGVMENVDQPNSQYRMQAQGYIDIELFKGLKFRSANNINFNYGETDAYWKTGAKNVADPNRGQYSSTKTINISSENTLNYSRKFAGIHQVNVLAGASVYKRSVKKVGVLGFDFPTEEIHMLSGAGRIDQYEGTNIRTGTWLTESAMASFFGRVNYALKDRYLLSATVRSDGSSKFGKDNRWGWFPSISAGWRISEESFLRKVKWLSQLKLRLSYGVTGTDAITDYSNVDLLSSAGYPLGTGNGEVNTGLANNTLQNNVYLLGNNKLKWEQANEYNGGIDVAFLNNRIAFTVDYFYTITKNLLYQKTVNSVSGYGLAWTNEGKMRTKGVELELTTYNFRSRNFKWSTSLNFSRSRNRLLDLGGPAEQITQGGSVDYYINRVGDPTVQFYGFKVIGVWKDQDEINNNPHHINDKPGGLRVANTNGDDVINDDDRVILGNPYPDFNWGMTNTLNYYDFDFSFTFQGQVGGQVYNIESANNAFLMNHKKYVSTDRWLSAEHPGNGKVPYTNSGINHMLTDYALEDVGYLALRDVTLGYTLPKKNARKLGISKLRVYLSAQNLLYIWNKDYRGINPESRSGGGIYNTAVARNGKQGGGFPIQKTIGGGINIEF